MAPTSEPLQYQYREKVMNYDFDARNVSLYQFQNTRTLVNEHSKRLVKFEVYIRDGPLMIR